MEAYCDHKWSLVHHSCSIHSRESVRHRHCLEWECAFWFILVYFKIRYGLSKMVSASRAKSLSPPDTNHRIKLYFYTAATHIYQHLTPGQLSAPTAHLRLPPPHCHPPPTVQSQVPSQQMDGNDCQSWNTCVLCTLLRLTASAASCLFLFCLGFCHILIFENYWVVNIWPPPLLYHTGHVYSAQLLLESWVSWGSMNKINVHVWMFTKK